MKLQTTALVLIASLLIVSTQPALAGGKSTGELTPSGTVLINNASVSSSVTVVSDSHIVTMANSGAVINLGGTGQVFIGENSDLMLNFEQTWVRIELSAGSVRVQGGGQSQAFVTTNTCGRVEISSGSVMVLTKSGAKEELKAGESKEFMDKMGFASNSMTGPTDYRVSTISCNIAAAPRAKPSRRGLFIAIFAGAGAAGGLAPILGGGGGGSGGGGNPIPASQSRP